MVEIFEVNTLQDWKELKGEATVFTYLSINPDLLLTLLQTDPDIGRHFWRIKKRYDQKDIISAAELLKVKYKNEKFFYNDGKDFRSMLICLLRITNVVDFSLYTNKAFKDLKSNDFLFSEAILSEQLLGNLLDEFVKNKSTNFGAINQLSVFKILRDRSFSLSFIEKYINILGINNFLSTASINEDDKQYLIEKYNQRISFNTWKVLFNRLNTNDFINRHKEKLLQVNKQSLVFLSEYQLNHMLNKEEINFQNVALPTNVSTKFLTDYKRKISWENVIEHTKLTRDQLYTFKHYFNWEVEVCDHQDVPDDLIEELQDEINIEYLIENRVLNKKMFSKYYNTHITFRYSYFKKNNLPEYQLEHIITDYHSESIEIILGTQRLSESFILQHIPLDRIHLLKWNPNMPLNENEIERLKVAKETMNSFV